MTKRYFGRDGQRITRSAEPEPEEWIPVIERVARGEISKRAARDELTVSDTRINAMLAHVRGEATDPTIARKAMDDKLADPEQHRALPQTAAQHRARLRQHQSQPRIPHDSPAAASRRAQRMAPDLHRPQPPQAPASSPRLTSGPVRPRPGRIPCTRPPAPDSRDSLRCAAEHHRAKTHGRWTYTALERGTYVWTSPPRLPVPARPPRHPRREPRPAPQPAGPLHPPPDD